MKWLKNLFKYKPTSEDVVFQVWEYERESKIRESKFTRHPIEYTLSEQEKLKLELDKIGATNISIYAEGYIGPKIKFDLNGKEIISNEIFDFTCEKIMEDIKQKIK